MTEVKDRRRWYPLIALILVIFTAALVEAYWRINDVYLEPEYPDLCVRANCLNITGDITTNGTFTLINAVEDDLRFPVTEVKVQGAVNLPTWGAFLNSTILLYFDNGDQAYLTAQIPHTYKEGTDISPHFHWTADTLVEGNNITWCMEYTWANIDDTFPGTAITCVNDTYQGPNIHHITPEIIINGTGKEYSSMLVMRIYRGTDGFADSIALLEFDIHYLKDKLGQND